jgi:1,4-dihydroxy-2-naphthoyl-CoA hydrolase
MSDPADVPVPVGTAIPGFDGLYGLELEHASPEGVRGHVRIDERHLQPFGLVHGGVYAAMAESMASYGTAMGVGATSPDGDKFVAGLSNHTSFVRPAFGGDTVSAVATPRHRGSTTWVWEVECSDGQGRLCALIRVTIAVRDARR